MGKRPRIPNPFWVQVVSDQTSPQCGFDLVQPLLIRDATITIRYQATPYQARIKKIPQEGMIIIEVDQVGNDRIPLRWEVFGLAKIEGHPGRYRVECHLYFNFKADQTRIRGQVLLKVHPAWIGVS
jgi:hypothetical protein